MPGAHGVQRKRCASDHWPATGRGAQEPDCFAPDRSHYLVRRQEPKGFPVKLPGPAERIMSELSRFVCCPGTDVKFKSGLREGGLLPREISRPSRRNG